jgi:hypothetical protein
MNATDYEFSTKPRWHCAGSLALIALVLGAVLYGLGAGWPLELLPVLILVAAYPCMVVYRVRASRELDELTVTSNRMRALRCGNRARPSEYTAVTLTASLLPRAYQVGLSAPEEYFEVASLYDSSRAVELAEGLAQHLELPLRTSGAFESALPDHSITAFELGRAAGEQSPRPHV